MTLIDLAALETALGLPEPVTTGLVSATYWAGHRPFVVVDGAEVTFPTPIRVQIVAGEPVEPLELVGTEGVSCVKWVITSYTGGSLTRYTTIPDSGTVEFGDLPVVDPDGFAPASNPSVLDTVQSQLLGGLTLQRVTQAEYDAIPTPNPDVLYVIKN